MALTLKAIALALLFFLFLPSCVCTGTTPMQTGTPTQMVTTTATVTPTLNTQITFWITGYSAEEGFDSSTRTACKTISGWGTMAVDPTVLPYGSVIYSQKYATLCGRYLVALDTGSAIRGYHLDYWTETNSQAASITGFETVTLLRWGWYGWFMDPEKWGLER